MENLQLTGFNNSISYLESVGLSKCFRAYADDCSGEDILQIGFNANSGYVYIALENGITIGSMLGCNVDYIVTDFEDGEEHFFDEYVKALSFNN